MAGFPPSTFGETTEDAMRWGQDYAERQRSQGDILDRLIQRGGAAKVLGAGGVVLLTAYAGVYAFAIAPMVSIFKQDSSQTPDKHIEQ